MSRLDFLREFGLFSFHSYFVDKAGSTRSARRFLYNFDEKIFYDEKRYILQIFRAIFTCQLRK